MISRDRDRGDAHHERVQRVLGAHEAGVEEAERGRHHQDERGRGEHPRGVAGVDLGGLGERQDVHDLRHRRHGEVVGLAGADAHDALERDDEDLAVADLVGAPAVAERVDRRLDERVGDGDLEAHLVGEADLHGRAAVGLDAVELAAVALHAAHREPAHLGAVEGFQHVVRLLRPHDADHELHSPAPSLTGDAAGRRPPGPRPATLVLPERARAYPMAWRTACGSPRLSGAARPHRLRATGDDRPRSDRPAVASAESGRPASGDAARGRVAATPGRAGGCRARRRGTRRVGARPGGGRQPRRRSGGSRSPCRRAAASRRPRRAPSPS